ncbi:hypothetical protein [Microvirga aerilata]|uniref:hypothetical protein n=1 Tax=Microvirga aerilata TaxID=670292 RepID=UPI001FE51CEA|nr:hypothetical protein [Microvirga aerilata]
MKTLGASLQKRISPLSGGLKFFAVLSLVAGFGLAAESVQAAPAGHGAAAKPSKEPVTAVAAKDVETTSSVGSATGSDPYCNISRKRLFVEGEGWIVRRVTTCY